MKNKQINLNFTFQIFQHFIFISWEGLAGEFADNTVTV